MTVTAKNDMFVEARIPHKPKGKTTDFLLISDVHFDHPDCDRKLFFSLMDEAMERDAKILINGDLLCLMQGKKDRRGNKSSIRPEHNQAHYFNSVLEETLELLRPYSQNIMLIGDGNHETAILNHQEFDILGMLTLLLNKQDGVNVIRQGYHGFVKFVFHREGAAVRSKLMYRHHGKWGGEVMKGAQAVARIGLMIPQAEIVWTGHTHDRHVIDQPRIIVNQTGQTMTENALHIRTGTFKDEFNKPGGFGVERLARPQAKGGGTGSGSSLWAGSSNCGCLLSLLGNCRSRYAVLLPDQQIHIMPGYGRALLNIPPTISREVSKDFGTALGELNRRTVFGQLFHPGLGVKVDRGFVAHTFGNHHDFHVFGWIGLVMKGKRRDQRQREKKG